MLLTTIKDFIYSIFKCPKEFDSKAYWQDRYAKKGNSGPGSYGRLAEWKAMIINDFIKKKQVRTVIELGCGDGNQLKHANYIEYSGYDASDYAVNLCRSTFKKDSTKKFANISELVPTVTRAELGLSLDVIFHLIEDEIYEDYMKKLFQVSTKYVIIYSSNYEGYVEKHVKCRRFTDWVEKNTQNQFQQTAYIPNIYPFDTERPNDTSMCDFYIFERID